MDPFVVIVMIRFVSAPFLLGFWLNVRRKIRLRRDLPRRDACRRMIDLLFIAHDRTCGTELALLLAEDLDAGRVPDPGTPASRLTPRPMALPGDVAVAHPSLDSFDTLPEARA